MVNLRIPRTATFAWSEQSARPLIATGTVAGAVDADFSNATHLELWDLDLDSGVSEASELTPKASITTDARFHDIAWGNRGVIAGALENGTLDLWKADSLFSGETSTLESLSKHTGSIKALQFNPFKDELLLTAGVKGEIYVWDLNNTANPFHLGTRAARADDFSSVDWNKKVPHILLSGGKNGLVTVWDVKQKKESLTLSHLGRKEVSAVAWHPENTTKLLTALPDDSNPVIMVWDLRNANAPERTLTGHDQGVLSLDWCKQDPDILLSSGKDNRTICWNPNSGEVLGEFPIGTNWMFQTRFNPKNPNIMASASFDGKISIRSLQSKSQSSKVDSTSGALDGEDFFNQASFDPQGPSFSLKQAPRWYKRPVGASFGFGGKLVSFGTPAGQKSTLKITTLAVESDVRSATDAFETALKDGDFATLCDQRIGELSSENEKAEWTILKTLFDASPKKKIIEFLGFTPESSADASNAADALGEKVGETQVNGTSKERRLSAIFGGEDDDAFLTEISSTKGARTNNPFSIFAGNESEADKNITRALILGNFERAVDICISEDRLSDAFMLAVAGGENSLQKVQKAYFSKQTNAPNYIRLLASVVGKNLWDVVYNADLADWKEVLCAICTFAEDKEFAELCEALGERLEVEQKSSSEMQKRQDAATCYLSSSRLDKVIGIWIEEYKEHEAAALETPTEGSTSFSIHVKSIQQLIEKVTVFRQATKFVDAGMNATSDWKLAPLYDIYCEYADVLATQGQLEIAAKYLNLVPTGYKPAEISRSRVNIASGQAVAKKPTAPRNINPSMPARTAARSPYPGVAPASQPQLGSSTVPTQPYSQGYKPSGYDRPTSYTPQQTVQTSSRYTPTPSATPQVHQPPGVGNNAHGGYRPGPPPTTFSQPPNTNPIVPAAQRTDLPHWNDLPPGFEASRRKATPSNAGAGVSTFHHTQGFSSSPTASNFVAPQRAGTPLEGPPQAGQLPASMPQMSSGGPYQPSNFGSQASSAYVPQSPPHTLPGTGTIPGRVHTPSSYAAPPTTLSTGPPSNRYTPSSSTQNAPSGMSSMGPGRGMMHPGTTSYTAPPSAQLTYNQPSQYGSVPPPQASSMTGPPMTGPPMSGPPMSGPPMTGPPMTGPPPMGPPRGSSAIGSRPGSTAPPPKTPTPKPKHPKGDRSHIPEHSRLLFEVVSEQMDQVIANAPADAKTQVSQLGKRLDTFYDHLNNDDLFSLDAIQGLTDTFVQVRNKNIGGALGVFGTVQTEIGSFGPVFKKLIQLCQYVYEG
ncbi:hypothetical protein AA313_de0205382 [Arthrobotrys entomopaga]|nr:hypothetical protein AA313_de0205382 [Arthrobotrys entomopaga]